MRRWAALLVLVLAALALVALVGRGPADQRARSDPQPADAGVAAEPSLDAPPAAASATLLVEVRDERGGPVPGVDVSLTARGAPAGRQPTDATGVAAFPGRTELALEAWVHPPGGGGARLSAGRFLPALGDARIVFTLRPARRLVLEVTCDGARRLPEEWRLLEPVLLDAAADPETGIVRGRFHPTLPRGRARVFLVAPQYRNGGADITTADDRDPLVLRIDLVTGCDLGVSLPAGLDLVRQLRVEQCSEDGSWRALPLGAFEETEGGSLLCSYRVRPGDCRLVLASSGVVVDATTIGVEEHARSLAPDLRGTGWCDIRVDVPNGHDPHLARLVVTGDRVADEPPYPRGRGGQWRVLVPESRTLDAHAVHPLLVPAREGGTQRIAPGGSVTLRMEPGPLLVFRLVGKGYQGGGAGVTIRSQEGAAPVFRRSAEPVPEGLAVTGWEPGSWVVTVDPYEGVPVTLHARLDPGGTRLGDIQFVRGSRVRVTGGPGTLHVIARSEEHPGLVRRSWKDAGGAAEIVGLPAGTWDLEIEAGGFRLERSVSVDGATDAALALGTD